MTSPRFYPQVEEHSQHCWMWADKHSVPRALLNTHAEASMFPKAWEHPPQLFHSHSLSLILFLEHYHCGNGIITPISPHPLISFWCMCMQCVYMFMCVSVGTCMPQCIYRGQRATLGVGSHLLPYSRQGLSLFTTMSARIADPRASRRISHLCLPSHYRHAGTSHLHYSVRLCADWWNPDLRHSHLQGRC